MDYYSGSKAYLKLVEKRKEFECQLEYLNEIIEEIREKAKNLKKSSDERKELNSKVNDIENSKIYRTYNYK